ncbi:MAG: ABC transporter ATP-binding protein, partial [Bacteroidales bacterium]|nr:ABC transporter ATP-binding protein [Bacteroidales bacterium]
LGPNGAGKTTLIRIINHIIRPDSGTLLLQGSPLTEREVSLIGYLPEERGLYKKMKVGEQALYLARLKGLSRADATQRLREWFDRFEINSWWNRPVEELSKGMQQKVQFICTVLHEPRLLIFDEPFSGFDPVNATLLKNEILRLRDNGATVILSTHNMASVEEICDDIALINKSRTVLSGSVRQIRESYRKNLFEVSLRETGGWRLEQQVPFAVTDVVRTDAETTARVQLPPDTSANYLIALLLLHSTLLSFKEILPSMNEIFIQTVAS